MFKRRQFSWGFQSLSGKTLMTPSHRLKERVLGTRTATSEITRIATIEMTWNFLCFLLELAQFLIW